MQNGGMAVPVHNTVHTKYSTNIVSAGDPDELMRNIITKLNQKRQSESRVDVAPAHIQLSNIFEHAGELKCCIFYHS